MPLALSNQCADRTKVHFKEVPLVHMALIFFMLYEMPVSLRCLRSPFESTGVIAHIFFRIAKSIGAILKYVDFVIQSAI